MIAQPRRLGTNNKKMPKSKGKLEGLNFRRSDNGGYIVSYGIEYPSAKNSERGWDHKEETYDTKDEVAGRVVVLLGEYLDDDKPK